jgi:hypothetical protein
MATKPQVCTPRQPPNGRRAAYAEALTVGARGDARPSAIDLLAARSEGRDVTSPAVIAAIKGISWGSRAARLTTGFFDTPSATLRNEILRYLNLWRTRANVQFVFSQVDPVIRIARWDGPSWGGYWSYLGTEILDIPRNEPTMNLEGFTLNTPQREYHRVVCHEGGHTLGFPHEHMRRELVAKVDRQKAYAYFERTEGWSKTDVDDQVLTALNAATLIQTPPDETSIMCYQLPGEITKDGKPILGGLRINQTDHDFAARIYPMAKKAPRSAKPSARGRKKKATRRKAGATHRPSRGPRRRSS